MTSQGKTGLTIALICAAFSALTIAFLTDAGGSRVPHAEIPLVDTNFLDKSTTRQSYADLARAGADLSDFDCYVCHEKNHPPPLRFDTNQNIIIPKEHSDIVMGHGSHGRNNNCFNCHNETNLTLLQARDGRQLSFTDSTYLCGSCHGPTFRDWLAGAHGRISGYWDRGATPFSADEVRDLSALVERLKTQADPVSGFVWQQLTPVEQSLLAQYQPSAANTNQVRDTVLNAFNKIIREEAIYTPERFKGVPLAIPTSVLEQQNPQGESLAYLNRLLIEDAFPTEMDRAQRKDCVNCHNPHSPPFPSRKPAPGPHPLRDAGALAGPLVGQE